MKNSLLIYTNTHLFRLVRTSTDTETQLVSVERIGQYLAIEQEAPPIIEKTMPPHDWPQHGAIEMRNLQLRYR